MCELCTQAISTIKELTEKDGESVVITREGDGIRIDSLSEFWKKRNPMVIRSTDVLSGLIGMDHFKTEVFPNISKDDHGGFVELETDKEVDLENMPVDNETMN